MRLVVLWCFTHLEQDPRSLKAPGIPGWRIQSIRLKGRGEMMRGRNAIAFQITFGI